MKKNPDVLNHFEPGDDDVTPVAAPEVDVKVEVEVTVDPVEENEG